MEKSSDTNNSFKDRLMEIRRIKGRDVLTEESVCEAIFCDLYPKVLDRRSEEKNQLKWLQTAYSIHLPQEFWNYRGGIPEKKMLEWEQKLRKKGLSQEEAEETVRGFLNVFGLDVDVDLEDFHNWDSLEKSDLEPIDNGVITIDEKDRVPKEINDVWSQTSWKDELEPEPKRNTDKKTNWEEVISKNIDKVLEQEGITQQWKNLSQFVQSQNEAAIRQENEGRKQSEDGDCQQRENRFRRSFKIQYQNALYQKRKAEKQKEAAIRQQEEAEKQLEYILQSKKMVMAQQKEAERQRKEALRQQVEAERQFQEGLKQEKQAKKREENKKKRKDFYELIGFLIGILVLIGFFYDKRMEAEKNNSMENTASMEIIESNEVELETENITLAEEKKEEESDGFEPLSENLSYSWDFSDSLEEKNGLQSVVHGDVEIVKIPNSDERQAAYFDGDGDYIVCGEEINLTENFTLNILLCCEDVNKEYSNFLAKYEKSGKGPYAFSIRQGHINCWITEDNNRNYTEIESATLLNNNEWYFISIVKRGNNFQIYINGQLDAEGNVKSTIHNNNLVTIGRQALMFPPEEDLQFTGYIGEISIYNEALSEDTIQLMADEKVPVVNTELLDNIEKVKDIPEYAYSWNNHYYAVFDHCDTWEEAKSYCESRGGHLATILSEEENQAVFSFLNSSGYKNAYFGLSDNVQEGSWYWVTGDEVEYQNWHENEPNMESKNEDYAMFYYKYTDGTWNDGDFGRYTANSGKAFICEWDETMD